MGRVAGGRGEGGVAPVWDGGGRSGGGEDLGAVEIEEACSGAVLSVDVDAVGSASGAVVEGLSGEELLGGDAVEGLDVPGLADADERGERLEDGASASALLEEVLIGPELSSGLDFGVGEGVGVGEIGVWDFGGGEHIGMVGGSPGSPDEALGESEAFGVPVDELAEMGVVLGPVGEFGAGGRRLEGVMESNGGAGMAAEDGVAGGIDEDVGADGSESGLVGDDDGGDMALSVGEGVDHARMAEGDDAGLGAALVELDGELLGVEADVPGVGGCGRELGLSALEEAPGDLLGVAADDELAPFPVSDVVPVADLGGGGGASEAVLCLDDGDADAGTGRAERGEDAGAGAAHHADVDGCGHRKLPGGIVEGLVHIGLG